MRFGTPYDEVYAEDAFVPERESRLSLLANAVSYGTGTFEGIRACWNPDHQELYLLEARAHYERMARSARILGLVLPYDPDRLAGLTAELLRRNGVRADAYVRPLLLQADRQLAVRMHDSGARLYLAATPMPGDYIDRRGVRCMVSAWRRTADAAVPNRAKVIGSYVGPALAKTDAVRNGFDEAIMLTGDGHVAEATTSNLLIRTGDRWATPAATDDILAGITRRQVMQLLRELTGAAVEERRVHRSELYSCDEALLCGTAVLVAPVVEVDCRPVGDGQPGGTTLAVQRLLQAISRREDPAHPEWTTPVYGAVPC
ncbi:aminotransferase class IV [Nonomuraea gerenzanensis]|uniref:Branched-chain amino acid aminotransferase n=1 Tax=Nonomuraea gerenzanensis TaxID=93944 RepID=A0A1M4EQR7_9ACTN|nr:aminotransferase class IV [Nonomuraea gerenzanensis]UBU12609.1 aminotransferase class IV [Nonomuraea gerenzanensis]SBP01164.1 Branched-chain amino acid aminotransferase [Nonomuraea gerenzanensis]